MTALRAVLVGAGLAALGYGLLGLVTNVSVIGYLLFAAAVLFGHDLLVAPVVLLLGRLLRRLGRLWGGALVVSGLVTLVALPYLLGLGYRATNPSALPLDYRRGLFVTLGAVWLGTAALALLRRLADAYQSKRRHSTKVR